LPADELPGEHPAVTRQNSIAAAIKTDNIFFFIFPSLPRAFG